MKNCLVRKENGKAIISKRPAAIIKRKGIRLAHGLYYWLNNYTAATITMEYDSSATEWKLYNDSTTAIYTLTGITHTRTASHFSAAEFIHSGSEYLIVNAHTSFSGEQLYALDDHLNVTHITNALHGYPAVGSGNYPVPGVVELDGYIFSGFIDGKIYNSNLNDYTTWTATDFITAERKKDVSRYICKHNNNICLMGSESIEFFYDAGNPSGSPLARREDVYYDIGVATTNYLADHPSADSNDHMIAFIGSRGYAAGTQTLGVYVIENFRLKKISTPSIDKRVGQYDRVKIISLVDREIIMVNEDTTGDTYVYDTMTGLWYFWDFANISSDTVDYQITGAHHKYFIEYDTGRIYSFTEGLFKDGGSEGYGTPYSVIQTSWWDGGSMANKFFHTLSLVAVTSDESGAGDVITVKWRDNINDAFTSGRDIDMRYNRPIHRLGSARKRQWQFTHHNDGTFHLERMDLLAGSTDNIRDQ